MYWVVNQDQKVIETYERETKKEFELKQMFNGNKAAQGEESIRTRPKKPLKQEWTFEHKDRNKELAQQRIVVEHLIRKEQDI